MLLALILSVLGGGGQRSLDSLTVHKVELQTYG